MGYKASERHEKSIKNTKYAKGFTGQKESAAEVFSPESGAPHPLWALGEKAERFFLAGEKAPML